MTSSSIEVRRHIAQIPQNAARLGALNRVPGDLQENRLLLRETPSRSLTIRREQDIVTDLAFLAATTDDPSRVMAICLEECPDNRGVVIRMASNTGDMLEEKEGFRRIADALECATRREHLRTEDQRAVLQEIIALDYRRVLLRLRSRHELTQGKKKDRPPPALILQLSEVLRSTSLRVEAQNLLLLHEQLDQLPAVDITNSHHQNILMEIVQQASELNSDNRLSNVLESLSKIDPSLKSHLPLAFGKVGRYYTASKYLVSAARKQRQLFRRIDVETVQLECFPIDAESMQIKRFVAKNLGQCKIHAEIQLLFFYESHPEFLRPRVICSNKSACYLCNLFFHEHGLFHIPSTHGKLYTKWILPDWTEIVPSTRHQAFSRTVDQVNMKLEREIAAATASGRRIVNHPNESQLFQQLQWSLSTVFINPPQGSGVSIPNSEIAGPSRLIEPFHVAERSHIAEPSPIAEPSHIAGPSHQGLHCATDCIIPEIPKQQEATGISKAGSSHSIHTPPSPGSYSSASASTTDSSLVSRSSDGSSRNISTPSFHPDSGPRFGSDDAAPTAEHEAVYFNLDLNRGETVWKNLGVNGSIRISTTSIHATLSHQGCSNGDEKCLLDCWIHVRWLLATDEMDVNIRSVSLKALPADRDFSLPPVTHEQISQYITHKRDIVLVEFRHNGPPGN